MVESLKKVIAPTPYSVADVPFTPAVCIRAYNIIEFLDFEYLKTARKW